MMRISIFLDNFNKIKLTEKLLLLYVILLPVMNVSVFPALGNKIQYAEAAFVALGISFFLDRQKKRANLFNTPFAAILILIAVVFILSFKNSVNLFQSGIELSGFLYLSALYFMVNQLCRREDFYITVLAVWMGASLIVAVLGIVFYLIYQVWGLRTFFILDFSDAYESANRFLSIRLRSFLIHPNALASYLHASMIFLFVLLAKIKHSKIAGLLGCISFIVFFIALFWTKSRLTAGVFLSLFLISLYWQKRNVLRLFRYMLFAVTVALLIFSIVSVIWWIFPVDYNLDANQGIFSIAFNALKFPYYFQYKAAIDMFKTYPFTGIGIGSFNYWASRYINWEQAKASYLIMDPYLVKNYGRGMDPHSTYFGLLAETGLLGLSAVLLFLILFIVRVLNFVYKEKEPDKKYTLWCLFSGIVGFLWNGIYIEILTMRYFWFLLAMTAVFLNRHKKLE